MILSAARCRIRRTSIRQASGHLIGLEMPVWWYVNAVVPAVGSWRTGKLRRRRHDHDSCGLDQSSYESLRDTDTTGQPHSFDRYVIEGIESGGLLAVVEHNLAPRVLAAPLHRHSPEDEYSLVMEGRLGVYEDGAEVVVGPGELVFKPRGRWHTFWNAGEEPLRLLELITPAGIEQAFRKLASPESTTTPRRSRHWPRSMAARSTSTRPCS